MVAFPTLTLSKRYGVDFSLMARALDLFSRPGTLSPAWQGKAIDEWRALPIGLRRAVRADPIFLEVTQ